MMEHSAPGDWIVFLFLHLFVFGFAWVFMVRPLVGLTSWEPPPFDESMFDNGDKKRKYNPDDHWEDEVNYETGEISSNARPTIRHPKNRDRAYSGGA